MNLVTFARDVYPLNRHVSEGCLRNYVKHCKYLEKHARNAISVKELSQQLVSSWLLSLLADGRSPYYVSALRSSIVAVWSLARELDSSVPPVRCAAIRRPDLNVRVWTGADVLELSRLAATRRGPMGRLRLDRGPYLSTMILAAWYTGLRRGDLHRIRRDQVGESGAWLAIANKTGRRKPCWMPPQLIAAVDEWCDPCCEIWPRPGTDEVIRRLFRQLVDDLARQRGRGWYRGRWRDIRRSAEYSAETRHPGLGHQHAGHERRTYERYYQATVSEPGVLPEILAT